MGRYSRFSRHLFAVVCTLLWSGALMPAAARAQVPDDRINPDTIEADPPAHVSFVDGAAVLERDGQPDSAPANMPLLAGDRLRTQGGRVEILFADGSTLHMDANTTMDFQSDELVRLLDGRIRLAIPGPDRAVNYRVDAPSGSAVIGQPGEYRVAVLHGTRDGEIELAVLRGAAELVNDDGRTPLRAGERAFARANAAPSYAYAFNSATWDAFDRWSEARRDQRLGVSTQYLPDEVRSYAPSFDNYGAWRYDTSYGYVWYPTVSVDWRPYYRGRWVTLRPYGWTWVGLDPWAWPTHHYGRWGFSAGAWFWIPGRTWGPAWVSWAYAPGYVSWCPLGWNNRPVLQFATSYGRGYDPWRAWTAVSRRHFGVDYVNVHYVAGHTFDARTRSSFVPRYSAPASTGYAVPRSASPIRVAGTGTARSRPSSAPVYTNLEPGASRVGQGGPRVMVGPSRNSVAPPQSSAGSRSAPADGGANRGLARPRAGAPRPDARESTGAPGTFQREGDVRRAVPREGSSNVTPGSAPRSYGVERGQVNPQQPQAGAPAYRDNPYARRAPDRADPAAPRPGIDRDAGEPIGRAAPESPNNRGTARPRGYDYPGYGAAPRPAPEAARPGPPPESRPYGGDRRAPAAERPSGPPPESARPAPPANRGNPGSERGPAAAPDNRGGAPAQGHTRGGQPSSGTASRRGGR